MWVCVCLCVGGGDKSVERDGRREGVRAACVCVCVCVEGGGRKKCREGGDGGV